VQGGAMMNDQQVFNYRNGSMDAATSNKVKSKMKLNLRGGRNNN
jgi:hypothetical protein